MSQPPEYAKLSAYNLCRFRAGEVRRIENPGCAPLFEDPMEFVDDADRTFPCVKRAGADHQVKKAVLELQPVAVTPCEVDSICDARSTGILPRDSYHGPGGIDCDNSRPRCLSGYFNGKVSRTRSHIEN